VKAWPRWALWLGALAALTAVMAMARARLDTAHVALAYLLAVLGATTFGGRALGFAVSGAAFVAFNWFFLHPVGTLGVDDPLDWLVLGAFLTTSLVVAQLLHRATTTAEAATQRAAEVDRLAALGAASLAAPGAVEALQAVASVVRSSAGADVCEVYRRDAEGRVLRAAAEPSESPLAALDVDAPLAFGSTPVGAVSLVGWLAANGRSAVELLDGSVRLAPEEVAYDTLAEEAGADRTLAVARMASVRHAVRPDGGAPAVRAVLLPLVVRGQTVGVLRLASADGLRLTPEQGRLLVALAPYAALGVERLRLVESAERAEAERRVESLRSALLTAVSHDLRTPLTTIKGVAHELAHGGDRARAGEIAAEADRLDALVADLLDLSRIHAGAVRPAVAVNTADELVGAALQRAAGALAQHRVDVSLPPDTLLLGRFDFTQALRALVNLLENAAKYAPAGTVVEIAARREGDRLLVDVTDRGPGVPNAERERIFDAFYRPPGVPPDVRGTGLGLSIARGLAEAQGGTVRHAPRDGGGSVFTLELPAADDPGLGDDLNSTDDTDDADEGH
jgi:two-component system, OmpR family, sensor histidine kinase KdpD